MNKFTWSDVVTAKQGSSSELRPGSRAWVVGMTAEDRRSGEYLQKFPKGWVYTIEFEDGSDAEASEFDLVLLNTEK